MENILKTGETLSEKAVQSRVEESELFAADNLLQEHKRQRGLFLSEKAIAAFLFSI